MSASSQTRPSPWARLRARPRLLVVGGVVLVGVIAFVLWWFEPQALFIDRVVDEEFPAVAAEPEPEPAPGEITTDDAPDTDGADEPPEDPEGVDTPDAADAPDEPEEPEDVGVPDEPEDPADVDAPEAAEDDEVAEPTGPRALSSGGFESRNRYTVTGEATAYELEDGSRTLRLEPFESTNGPDLYVYLAAGDHADDDDTLAADAIDLGDLRGNIGSQNYPIPDDVDLDVHDTVVIWCERFTVAFGAADLAPTAE